VDHPVGRGAAYAFRSGCYLQGVSDLVQFIGRSERKVWAVSDYPEAVGPWNDGACAAFGFIIIVSKVGIDAAEIYDVIIERMLFIRLTACNNKYEREQSRVEKISGHHNSIKNGYAVHRLTTINNLLIL
jgi:hypothetical protein